MFVNAFKRFRGYRANFYNRNLKYLYGSPKQGCMYRNFVSRRSTAYNFRRATGRYKLASRKTWVDMRKEPNWFNSRCRPIRFDKDWRSIHPTPVEWREEEK